MAKTFATFCEKFTDVCTASATTDSDYATTTDDSRGSGGHATSEATTESTLDAVTVTATHSPTHTQSAGSSLQVSIAMLAVVGAAVLVL